VRRPDRSHVCDRTPWIDAGFDRPGRVPGAPHALDSVPSVLGRRSSFALY